MAAPYCGILGFRPSHGAIPVVGVIPMAQSFDTVGMQSLFDSLTSLLLAICNYMQHLICQIFGSYLEVQCCSPASHTRPFESITILHLVPLFLIGMHIDI